MNNKPTFFNKDMAKRLAKKTAIGGAVGFAGGGIIKHKIKGHLNNLQDKSFNAYYDDMRKLDEGWRDDWDNFRTKAYKGVNEHAMNEQEQDDFHDKTVNKHKEHWSKKEEDIRELHLEKIRERRRLINKSEKMPTGKIGAGIGFTKGLYDEVKRYRKEQKEHEEMNKQASDIKWADFETFKPQTLKLETFKPQTLKLETFKPQTGEWTKNNNSTKSSSPKDEGLSKNQKIGLGIGGVALTLYGAHRLRKYLKNRKEQKEQGE